MRGLINDIQLRYSTDLYRVYKKKVDPFKFKLSIIFCSDCVKTQGFLLMGHNHLKIYGISIGYG